MQNKFYACIVAGLALCACLMLSPTTVSYAQSKDSKAPKTPKTPPTAPKADGPMTAVLPGADKVALKCEPYYHSDVTTEVNVTNTTGQKIAAGTKIFWQTNKGAKGNLSVSGAGMAPNATLMGSGGDWQDNGPCTAYYVKK